jgi:hypothetical protein
MAGYRVECALKATIARTYQRFDFPGKQKVVNSHTHHLENLLRIAELEAHFKADSQNNPQLRANWAVVEDWTETSRYETRTRIQAADLYQAISQRNTGILAWIRLYW